MISCNLKHCRLQLLPFGKYLLSSPIPSLYFISEIPVVSITNRHTISERKTPIFRHSSSVCYQFPDQMSSFYDHYSNKIMYSTILTEALAKNYIQRYQKRYKSKKPLKRTEYDSGSDEEDDDEDDLSKASKPATLRVQSTRLDGLLKKALGIARNKVETAFYDGSIRVNGTRPSKKSYQVKIGDEVDLIKGISPLNPDFITVSRVEVLSVKEGDEGDELIVKIRRTKNMFVENYENDPWKKSSSSQ